MFRVIIRTDYHAGRIFIPHQLALSVQTSTNVNLCSSLWPCLITPGIISSVINPQHTKRPSEIFEDRTKFFQESLKNILLASHAAPPPIFWDRRRRPKLTGAPAPYDVGAWL